MSQSSAHREFLNAANGSLHKLRFFEPHLNEETVGLATGFEAVCVFVNDHVDAAVIARLYSLGVRLIALRCTGYNNVDLSAATRHGITVVRVPGVLALLGGRAHPRPYAGAQPESASRI
jgi:D-lactate dehydrogenase